MFYFFALVVAVFISNAQARLTAESIIGGVDGKQKEFPYQISLQKNRRHECGGAIIDSRYVLTAAHCVIDNENKFRAGNYKVVAGISYLRDNAPTRVEIGVAKAFIPALYNGTLEINHDDIAVLKLKKEFDLGPNSGQAKIPLPRSTKLLGLKPNNSFARKEAVVSGFGWDHVEIILTENENGDEVESEEGYSSGKLLKAKARILANNRCQQYFDYTIEYSQLCANIVQHDKMEKQGVCSYDSGGPLVSEDKLVGVVSNSELGCDDSVVPAIYTRVSAYVDLIDKVKRITDDIRMKTY